MSQSITLKEWLIDRQENGDDGTGYESEEKVSQSAFIIYDKNTQATLATLPLTIPIGSTVEGYTKAGLNVGWKWGVL